MTLAEKTLAIATANLGVTEKPKNSNSGPEVDIYLKSVGLKPGNPWCMAFVYHSVSKAASALDIPNPLIKTGHVMSQWNGTKLRKFSAKTANAVKPGDIMIMQFEHGRGHTGIVEKIKGSLVTCIEGNTNDDGAREGYEVARRERLLTSIHGFIQLP